MKNKEYKSMKVKGVEVDGFINEFVDKLLNVGMELEETNYSYGRKLKGTFLGIEDTEFDLYSFSETNLIHRVDISMPMAYSYDRPIIKYFRLKKLYSEEYGEPFKSDDNIDKYKCLPDDEIDEKIKEGELSLYSRYKLDIGWFEIYLDKEKLYMTIFNEKNYKYGRKLLLEKEMNLEINDIKQ